jgi:putative phosphoribosyl transferase
MDRSAISHSDVVLELDHTRLDAFLSIPVGASAIVLFAHGSGSGRHSTRNTRVAEVLQAAGLATLLVDLLTGEEQARDARTGLLRFDIDLLGARVVSASRWLAAQPTTGALPQGYFGASTGAAAALTAAAERPDIFAIVSRGGRPDLAGDAIRRVRAPTLLLVGSADVPILPLNEEAADVMGRGSELIVIPGATHLFEEPGALEEVARLSAGWFVRHLPPRAAGS